MRGSHDKLTCESEDSGLAAGRIQSGRVRLSLLSRESLLVAAVMGVIGVLVAINEGDSEADGRRAIESAHADLLESLVVAPDQQMLISCGRDDTVRFWDLGGGPSSWGREVERLPHDSHPFALALSPNRRFLAVGGLDGLTVWERRGDDWAVAFERKGGEYRSLAFTPDSNMLGIGSPDGVVRVVEAPSMREVAALAGFPERIQSVGFSPDGETLAAVDFNGRFKLWNWKSGNERKAIEEQVGPVHCFAFTKDGRSLAVSPWGIASGGPSLWDLETGALKKRFAGQVDGVNRIVISPDGRFLATATMNQSIKVWDIDSGEVAAVLDKDLGWVKAVAFTQDGARIAYGGRDGSIRFWDFARALDGGRWEGAIEAGRNLERTADRPSPGSEGTGSGLKSVRIAWSPTSSSDKSQGSPVGGRSGSSYSMYFSEDFAARSEEIRD